MVIQKPSIPKGTRDFGPEETIKRNYIFDTIKKVFQLYGYLPIETPAMETLDTLMGKYGEEGDRLIFKILNTGNFLKNINDDVWDEIKNRNEASSTFDTKKITSLICGKALRFDLTVPFARYVVQNQNNITFPFKRYQIQAVWRADRPQKSRYREFFQCDVDVIGSNSLINEVELIQIIDDVFNKLGINSIIKLNNRKILSGIAEIIGEADKIIDITVAIDKIEKIGINKVNEELEQKGLSKKSIENLQPLLNISGTTKEKLSVLKEILKLSEIGLKGIKEIEIIFNYLKNIDIKSEIVMDLTLARGLNYYTGVIIEVKAKDFEIGSICGGGRYDDLTGIFGLKDVSGVGISFGADRIYDVLSSLNIFPEKTITTTKVMFVNFGEKEEIYCLPILKKLRDLGINTEIYPSSVKMKKQMTYANNKNIPYVILIGDKEMKEEKLTLKNMSTGEQMYYTIGELIKYFENIY
ncbi:MAG: histidine--tRNA ligase [Bacteroidales bacterium]|nr:histidine--tRNA ligase [Bacteroidales bacterium]